MNAKILIVDDEKDLLELLSMNLGAEGYIITTAEDAAQALACIRTNRPDMILLDIMLPDTSGIKLTGKLKNTPETANIPIILLTAKDKETDVVVGLSVGADDYVTKPFSTSVLVARIEAVLRRAYPDHEQVREILSAGAITILPAAREVRVHGRLVNLTGGEYNILVALIEAGGSILSREKLKAALGEESKGEKARIIDVHIASLRKKLGPARTVIKTVHTRGYRIAQ
ncbi:MAG TPA: response regulator [Planctomycetes bacterium]|nr:response regulator [Planctomycetota bacterium]